MHIPRFLTAGLIGAAALGVSACTDGYGYSGIGVGIGSGGYYDGYSGYNGYGSFAGTYGDPYWGWYGDYYYPGTGYYVYDRDRRPLRWNDGQRRYWEQRRQGWRGDRRQVRDNWRNFRQDGQNYRPDRRGDDRTYGDRPVTRDPSRAQSGREPRGWSDLGRDGRRDRRTPR